MTGESQVADRNEALLGWYGAQRRDLPWRSDPDPYVTLVSEAMLQQTQVERVIPKFLEFMDLWPTIEDLAASTASDVLAAWSGLGYNSRALRLREAAAVVAEDGWPTSPADLETLPGVGPYTAAAISAIAFGERVAAVDTNLKRVISRWEGHPLSGRELDQMANVLVIDPAGDWNQALMDLGATLCRPKEPLCPDCPVQQWCVNPDVYEPPARQSSFEGSNRQLRGALVRASISGRGLVETGVALGRSEASVKETISDLRSEGLLPQAEDPAQ